MKYKIIRTDKADEQLWEIIFYIADDSESIDIALNYLNKTEIAISHLEEFSMSGSSQDILFYENMVIRCLSQNGI